jgi:hypothetical protein
VGWGSGSQLLGEVVELIDPYIYGDVAKARVYAKLIDLFEDHDCDTIDEARGVSESFDKAIDTWAEQFQDDWD